MILNGLDRLLREPAALEGRRYGLLSHAAAVTVAWEPILVALCGERAAVAPQVLFSPEHGFYGVEQDMVASDDSTDPLSGIPTISLYGSSAGSLRPRPEAFADLDLLLVDLVDVGARYYTYAATAVWATEVALRAGLEVWVLDRPNPLGGLWVEGNLVEPGFESFVGAFRLPARHGLTLGELVRLEAARGGWEGPGLRVWRVQGWNRELPSGQPGWHWRAPSPNMPSLTTAWLYPGSCLIEGTQLSEGRGTTRPFELIGAPFVDAGELSRRLNGLDLPGVRYLPTSFRPQFQKHAGEVCSGVEIVVTDRSIFEPYRSGVELVATLFALAPDACEWRRDAYEFVDDRPAIDLLAGCGDLRQAIESGGRVEDWVASWHEDEVAFRTECDAIYLYR